MELSASEIEEALSAPSLDNVSILGQDVALARALEYLETCAALGGCVEGVYDTWGFPIYRTSYGGDTDSHWEKLLRMIPQELSEELDAQQRWEDESRPGNPEAASQILSLFRLKPFSSPGTLEGASLDRLRQMYKDNRDDLPAKYTADRYHLFLVADAEVLAAVARGDSWVKIVNPRYRPEDFVIKNRRMGRGLWFIGYMWMTTRSLLCLWHWLDNRELELLAPPLLNNQRLTEVWNGVL
ncbi:uncharacterized protein DNG_05643 [Cephalotrichum gorgonifer]|uniref:Uncharacterized protein n=1 Tax=Cephalotrichum gorgonifer TaxID=2041049 RepID=A0AAE8MYN7_9PEZI|nr:uncharacterized protein DNG_05643 [Cephalotrichum gorgonifer]